MAGESAREKARAARAKAERLLAEAERWERGADGESRTATTLTALGPEWAVWHDLSWPGRRDANLDHLVIGPTGVFVIDSKNWSGSITVRDGELRQNGQSRERDVDACAESSLAVGHLIPEYVRVCHPVLCIVRDEPIRGGVRGVALSSTTTLLDTLTSPPTVLSHAQISYIANTLRYRMTSKSSAAASPTARSVAMRKTRSPSRPRRSKTRRSAARGLARIALFVIAAIIGLNLITSLGDRIVESIPSPTAPPTIPATPPSVP